MRYRLEIKEEARWLSSVKNLSSGNFTEGNEVGEAKKFFAKTSNLLLVEGRNYPLGAMFYRRQRMMNPTRLCRLIVAFGSVGLIWVSPVHGQGQSAGSGPQSGGTSTLMQPNYNNTGIGAPSANPGLKSKHPREKAVEVDVRSLKTGTEDSKFQHNLFGTDVKSIQEVKPVPAKKGTEGEAEHKPQEKVSAGTTDNGTAHSETKNTEVSKSEGPSPTASPAASASPAPAPEVKR